MSDTNKSKLTLFAVNKNDQIKKLQTFGDKLADKVTAIAGSTTFLLLNVVWFAAWVAANTGTFGDDLIFDEYPFGFLTMVVSLEAIILSVFVLISQNRQSERAEIRAELDYLTDLQADTEITTLISILERLAEKQQIDITDLLDELALDQKRITAEHPLTKKDLDL
ncbi:MAG: DUF1003 domain-containing protein [Patescibacteria group bacterium]